MRPRAAASATTMVLMTHRSAVRPALRRALPFAARWRVRAARRRIADALSAVRFVSRNGDAGEFTHLVCA